MNVNEILALSPYLEVVVRNVYWRSEFLVREVNARRKAKPAEGTTPPPRTWTGVLPTDLMKVPGAKRSLHPLNSVVAHGPHAEDMLRDNLTGERPFACGPGSSWDYCRQHAAKVVALGVDMAHSLTMIH